MDSFKQVVRLSASWPEAFKLPLLSVVGDEDKVRVGGHLCIKSRIKSHAPPPMSASARIPMHTQHGRQCRDRPGTEITAPWACLQTHSLLPEQDLKES